MRGKSSEKSYIVPDPVQRRAEIRRKVMHSPESDAGGRRVFRAGG